MDNQIDCSLEPYNPNRHHGLSVRIAEYLDRCAREEPGKMIPIARLAAVTLGLPFRLGEDSPLTRCVLAELYRARSILTGRYGRDIILIGKEARATVDGNEVVDYRYLREIDKALRQVARVRKTVALVEIQGFDSSIEPGLGEHLEKAKQALESSSGPLLELLQSFEELKKQKPALH